MSSHAVRSLPKLVKNDGVEVAEYAIQSVNMGKE